MLKHESRLRGVRCPKGINTRLNPEGLGEMVQQESAERLVCGAEGSTTRPNISGTINNESNTMPKTSTHLKSIIMKSIPNLQLGKISKQKSPLGGVRCPKGIETFVN